MLLVRFAVWVVDFILLSVACRQVPAWVALTDLPEPEDMRSALYLDASLKEISYN